MSANRTAVVRIDSPFVNVYMVKTYDNWLIDFFSLWSSWWEGYCAVWWARWTNWRNLSTLNMLTIVCMPSTAARQEKLWWGTRPGGTYRSTLRPSLFCHWPRWQHQVILSECNLHHPNPRLVVHFFISWRNDRSRISDDVRYLRKEHHTSQPSLLMLGHFCNILLMIDCLYF